MTIDEEVLVYMPTPEERERWRRQDRRMFPRRLHVRLDIYVDDTGRNDAALCYDVAESLELLAADGGFLSGTYDHGATVHVGRCRIEERYWHVYGETWYWRAWSRIREAGGRFLRGVSAALERADLTQF